MVSDVSDGVRSTSTVLVSQTAFASHWQPANTQHKTSIQKTAGLLFPDCSEIQCTRLLQFFYIRIMKNLVVALLNSTVGLDSQAVADLGFDLEPSPRDGRMDLVVSNVSSTSKQWIAVILMVVALVLAAVRYRGHSQFRTWMLGLLTSCLHNADNILRPGTYFTPAWIVQPRLLFPMDQAFFFWSVVLLLGVWSLRTGQKLVVALHSVGTSIGIMHYVAQSPSRFCAFAHITILCEVVMGAVVGLWLWQHNAENEAAVPYRQISAVETTFDVQETSLEMPKRHSGLRHRSLSPALEACRT